MKTLIGLVLSIVIFSVSYGQELRFAVRAGGSGNDRNLSIAVDKTNQTYTGVENISTATTNFNGSCSISGGTSFYDATFARWDSTGKCGTTFYFGKNADEIRSMCVDDSQYVYLTGYFWGEQSFCSSLAASNYDVFISKYTSTGTCKWTVKAGSTGADYGYDIAVDNLYNVYVTGVFQGTATFGSTNLVSSGYTDGFIAKYNRTGTLQWVKKFGGSKVDGGYGISNIVNGNLYIVGTFDGTATFGSYTIISDDSTNSFLAKIDTGGTFAWVKQGGSQYSTDFTTRVRQDNNGNVFLAGSKGGEFTFDTITSAGVGEFIARFTSSGDIVWFRSMGKRNTLGFVQPGIAIADSSIYFVGAIDSSTNIGNYIASTAGSRDILVSKLDYGGKPMWVKTFGSTGPDLGYAISCDLSGAAYISGEFSGTVSFGSTNLSASGSSDAFIAKLISATRVTSVADGNNVTCVCDSFNVGFIGNITFNSGNVFTVQLSDSNGSFSSPQAVGVLSSTSPGNIRCKILGNNAAGRNYRVRIVSSKPSTIGEEFPVDLRVNSVPTDRAIYALKPVVIKDSSTFLAVVSSERGIKYKLRIGNTDVATAIGTGSNIYLPTGTIDAHKEFNVVALDTATGCILYLDTISISVFTFHSKVIGEDLFKIIGHSDSLYFVVKNRAERYLDSLKIWRNLSGDTLEEEDGDEANFERWDNYTLRRLGSNGNFRIGSKEMFKFLFNGDGDCDTFNVAWESLGPKNSKGAVTQPKGRNNQGWIGAISVSKTNENDILVSGRAGGIWRSTDGGDHWHNTTDDEGYSLFGGNFVRHPLNDSIVFASMVTEQFGPWVSTSSTFYGMGIIVSLDGGESWERTGLIYDPTLPEFWNRVQLRGMAIDNNSLLPGGTNLDSSIMYAIDDHHFFVCKGDPRGQVNWHMVIEDWSQTFLSLNKTTNGNLLVVSDRNIYLYDKIDSSLQSITYPFANQAFNHHMVGIEQVRVGTNLNNQVIIKARLIAHDDSLNVDLGDTAYLRSNNNGITWESEPSDLAYYYSLPTWEYYKPANLIAPSLYNADIVYSGRVYYRRRVLVHDSIGGKHEVFTNGATTEMHGDIRSICIYRSAIGDTTGIGDVIFIGTDGGVLKKDSGTFIFKDINGEGLEINRFWGVGVTETNSDLIMCGAQDGGINAFNRGKWFESRPAGDNGDCIIDPVDNDTIWQEGNFQLHKMKVQKLSDGTFSTPGLYSFSPGSDYTLMPLALNPENHRNLYVGFKQLYETKNGGGSFESFYDEDSSNARITSIAICPSDPNIIYYSCANLIWGQGDSVYGNGTNLAKGVRDSSGVWSIHRLWGDTIFNNLCYGDSCGSSSIITDIVVHPTNKNRLWITFGGFVPHHKVLYSEDGGNTWINVSGCLPNLPVQSIVYQANSSDRIYIGTDYGVYYKDSTTTDWVRYGVGMYGSLIQDMEINNCGGYLAVATLSRGLWRAPLIPLDPLHITAANDDYYSSYFNRLIVFHQDRNIVIDSGAMLTIDSATIKFNKDIGVTVMPGGKLIITNSNLTEACNCTWNGIQVLGKPLETQHLDSSGMSNQGFLVLDNSTLEYALDAVKLHGDNSGTTLGAGGIIQATNSVFKNNRRSAEFWAFHNFYNQMGHTVEKKNASFFTNCSFLTDSNYKTSESYVTDITMWQTYGVKFHNCLFKDNREHVINEYGLAQGIYSIDGSYDVTNSTFLNLSHGIWANNAWFVTRPVNVTGCNFENNYRGVTLYNTDYSTVADNEFIIGHTSIDSLPIFSSIYGAGINGCTEFKFENNSFNTDNGMDATFNIGGWFNNTGEFSNEVKSNHFENIPFGIGINGINRTGDGIQGLSIGCNYHSYMSGFDFYVTGDMDATTNDGIRKLQGSVANNLTFSAGNRFNSVIFNGDTSYEGHFYNHSSMLVDYLWRDTANREKPQFVTSGYVVIPPIPAQNNANCPTMTPCYYCFYGDTNWHNSMLEQYGANNGLYRSKIDSLRMLIDGGNSSGLISNLTSATTADTTGIKATLLGISPFVSFKALKTIAERYEVFSRGFLLQIASQNPEVARSVEFQEYLPNSRRDIPGWMRDSVIGLKSETERTKLEREATGYCVSRDSILGQLIRNVLLDTNGIDHNLLQYWISRLDSTQALPMLVRDYAATGDFSQADSLLDIMQQWSPPNGLAVPFQMELDLLGIQLNAMSMGHNLLDLNDEEKSSLQEVALEDRTYENGNVLLAAKWKESTRAANILRTLTRDTGYYLLEENPIFPEIGPITRMARKPKGEESVNMKSDPKNAVKVYPNPAKDVLNIEFETPFDNDIVQIKVTDLLGREMIKFILPGGRQIKEVKTESWSNGSYIYEIQVNGTRLSSGIFLTRR